MGALTMPPLPTWEAAERSRSANTEKGMTAIERMVLDNEPAGSDDEVKFRDGLQAALQEAFDMGMAAALPAGVIIAEDDLKEDEPVPFALRKLSEFQTIGDLSVGGTALNVQQQVWLSLVAGALGDSNIDGKDAVDVADSALDLVLDHLEQLS